MVFVCYDGLCVSCAWLQYLSLAEPIGDERFPSLPVRLLRHLPSESLKIRRKYVVVSNSLCVAFLVLYHSKIKGHNYRFAPLVQ